MNKPHKDMLACVFCSCLGASSSLANVCWVDLFKASIRLSVSKCGGLKCLPPFVIWAIFVGSLGSESWGLKCLPPFEDVGLLNWGQGVSPRLWVFGYLIAV